MPSEGSRIQDRKLCQNQYSFSNNVLAEINEILPNQTYYPELECWKVDDTLNKSKVEYNMIKSPSFYMNS